MKKVYTITFHQANNYGAMLQSYALQKVLCQKYESKIINYNCHAISNSYKLFFKKGNSLLDTLKINIKSFLKIPFYYKRYNNFKKFRNKLDLTRKYINEDDLKNNYPKCDAYVTGSDQIWNKNITDGFDDGYFLNFGDENIKKISYAASIGDISIINNNKKLFGEKIKNIDAISVRENDLKSIIESTYTKKVTEVLDPTLLLTKEEWLNIINKKYEISEKYIFAYSVGNGNDLYYDSINELARKTGLKVIYFDRTNKDKKIKCNCQSFYSAGPDGFVTLLKNAEYVITTSFHGLALSINLQKNFSVILSSYPERLTTLLNSLQLNNRIIEKGKEITDQFYKKINWDEKTKKLLEIREKSLDWLFNSVEE